MKSNLIKKANKMETEKRSQLWIKNGDILLTMIGLLSLRKSDFDNVKEFFSDEEFYKLSLGISYGIPSNLHSVIALMISVSLCLD